MKRSRKLVVLFGSAAALVAIHPAFGDDAELDRPLVFQAAGPTPGAIEGVVAAYRAALGDPNNGNTATAFTSGRREINWDGGGGVDATTPPVTPFDVFLNGRGARFTTPGFGLTQAPPSGGPQGGLAALFDNPTYATIFAPFSALRVFAAVGSRNTDGLFFLAGTAGGTPAVVRGFGAVFVDVDRPVGNGPVRNRQVSTVIRYFGFEGDDTHERLIFTGIVPAAPGDAGQSFFGIVFEQARITRVRITAGSDQLGRNDTPSRDVVVMDDFLYGEPQPLPAN